ncbi:MAG: response regulator [Methylobacteriaceae bacterium]|nr:response regulator [Methylobacteriaceae bacterium]
MRAGEMELLAREAEDGVQRVFRGRFDFSLGRARLKIFLLIIVALAPVVMLRAYDLLLSRDTALTLAQERAQTLALDAAAAQGDVVERTSAALGTIAAVPFAVEADAGSCPGLLRSVAERSPWAFGFLVLRPDGSVGCSGGLADGAWPESATRSVAAAALGRRFMVATRPTRVGDPGRPAVAVARAVRTPTGDPRAVIVALVDLAWADKLLARNVREAPTSVTVISADGIVLARWPDRDRLVGQDLSGRAEVRALFRQQEGRGTAGAEIATDEIGAFATVPISGSKVVVGIDKARVLAAANAELGRSLLGLAAIVGVAALLAWLGAEVLILHWLNRLVEGARSLGHGDFSHRINLPAAAGELATVGAALDQAAAQLGERDAALRQAEAELRRRKAKYRLLADHSSDVIISKRGVDGPRDYVSPTVRMMLGYEVEEFTHLPMDAVVHPDDRPALDACYAALGPDRPISSCVHRARHKDGRWIWCEIALRRVDGDPPHFIGAIRDVTERQVQALDLDEARREAEAARRAAEEASQAKGELVASISHEIRTPLNAIIGYADMLLADPALPSTARRGLERIQTAGAALLMVANDVLDYSEGEAGRTELHPRPFELAALVADAVSIMRGAASRKGLALSATIASDVPAFVIGDRDRLQQVLLNLLNNGVKFTPAGSVRLLVGGELDQDGRARLRFVVEDTGIGISDEKLPRLFQRFSQGDDSIRREFGGSGLGLAISKSLVELMGGTIAVESEPGRGSAFSFELVLPVADGDDRVGPGEAASAPAGPPARVLLAEDLDINQEIVCAALEAAGHQVTIVSNGAEAVSACEAERFDLVLMDVEMPGTDGVTATRLLRAREGGRERVPIIALTADVRPDCLAELMAAGADGHLAKPFRRAQLRAVVARWSRAGCADANHGRAPTLDDRALTTLADLVGGAKLANLLDRLAGQLADRLSDAMLASGQRDELAAAAHTLVSGAGMLGFADLAQRCADLEAACRTGADIAGELARLREARARALNAIADRRAAA